MSTMSEYLGRPVEERLTRMARTPSDIDAAIKGYNDEVLSRRPDQHNWSGKEVICHLRDIEEVFVLRFYMMLGTDDPMFLVLGEFPPDRERWGLRPEDDMPLNPMRWAEERQYLKNDATLALQSFTRRRTELLTFLKRLSPEQLMRGSLHVTLGPMTFHDWLAVIAAHDDTHLAQLQRALDARP